MLGMSTDQASLFGATDAVGTLRHVGAFEKRARREILAENFFTRVHVFRVNRLYGFRAAEADSILPIPGRGVGPRKAGGGDLQRGGNAKMAA